MELLFFSSNTSSPSQEDNSTNTVSNEETAADVKEEAYEITYSNFNIHKNVLNTTVLDLIIEVTNTGSCNLYLGRAVIELEENGSFVASVDFISTSSSVIAPGEKGCYYADGASLNEGIDVDKEYTFIPTLKIKKATDSPESYEIKDTSIADSQFGGVVILGRVTNHTQEDDSLLRINVVVYDSNNIPIAVCGTNVLDFTAGSTVGFEANSTFGYGDIEKEDVATYKIYSQASYYQF